MGPVGEPTEPEREASRAGQAGTRRLAPSFASLVLVVIGAVLFLMLLLTGPRLVRHMGGRINTVEEQTRMLRSALDTMRLDIGRYPTAEEGLALLVTPPRDAVIGKSWHGPYIEGTVPPDPWGQPYHYSPVGKDPYPLALYSDGPPGDPPGPVIGYPPPH